MRMADRGYPMQPNYDSHGMSSGDARALLIILYTMTCVAYRLHSPWQQLILGSGQPLDFDLVAGTL